MTQSTITLSEFIEAVRKAPKCDGTYPYLNVLKRISGPLGGRSIGFTEPKMAEIDLPAIVLKAVRYDHGWRWASVAPIVADQLPHESPSLSDIQDLMGAVSFMPKNDEEDIARYKRTRAIVGDMSEKRMREMERTGR